ncbi:putative membrane protein [Alteribacillus persepolensis]|uniref:Putative membrane protein n=1 Tax=Alteribacillus persepolensis TaxID=568899 RepID=A0A1G8H2E9_9BACI|nr:cytochrome c oxidase assembly protein [Alteribacillus persepolensis]SDI00690.1 putative membrane protein [Alteribacillus persepolensis]
MYYVWSMILLLCLIFIGKRYVQAAKGKSETSRGKKISFVLGLCLFFAAQSVVALQAGSYSFFVHMIQQTITYFIVPILVIQGLTEEMAASLHRYLDTRWFEMFTKPMIAGALFPILFSLYYLPVVFDTVMSQPLLQLAAMLILLAPAFLMWWPMAASTGNDKALTPMIRIPYIFVIALLFTPIGIYIIFSEPLYSNYTLSGQQVGGTVWKVSTAFIYILMIGRSLSESVKLDREEEKRQVRMYQTGSE